MIKNSKTLKNIEWRNPEGDVRTLPRPAHAVHGKRRKYEQTTNQLRCQNKPSS